MRPSLTPRHPPARSARRVARALGIAALAVTALGFQSDASATGGEPPGDRAASTFALGALRAPSPLTLTRRHDARPADAGAACAVHGPYFDRTLAEAVADSLARPGVEAALRETAVRERIGAIVLAPVPADGAAALVAALRARGVDDLLVIGHGEFEGHVSLGVYNGPRSSERRRAELAALGFDTEIRTRTRTRAAWMVEVAADASADRCLPTRHAASSPGPIAL